MKFHISEGTAALFQTLQERMEALHKEPAVVRLQTTQELYAATLRSSIVDAGEVPPQHFEGIEIERKDDGKLYLHVMLPKSTGLEPTSSPDGL
jgi:hypothetical protein